MREIEQQLLDTTRHQIEAAKDGRWQEVLTMMDTRVPVDDPMSEEFRALYVPLYAELKELLVRRLLVLQHQLYVLSEWQHRSTSSRDPDASFIDRKD